MIDVLARIGEIEQRLRSVSRSRLLLAAGLALIVLLAPLILGLDPDDWLHLLGALATVLAGATGLAKAVQLWWTSTENAKEAIESEAVQELQYELTVTRRLLHVCEEGIGLYQESRFNPERFGR